MSDDEQRAETAAAVAATVTTAGADPGVPGRGEQRRADPPGTTAAAGAGEVERKVHELRFECLDNALYHGAREHFTARVHKILTGIQVFGGTAAFAVIFPSTTGSGSGDPVLGTIAASAVAVAGIITLVADPAASAREHRNLRGRFYEVLADIEESEPDQALVKRTKAALYRIYAGSLPTYRAAKAQSYNAAVDMIFEEEAAKALRLEIPWLHRRLANVFRFGGQSYAPAG